MEFVSFAVALILIVQCLASTAIFPLLILGAILWYICQSPAWPILFVIPGIILVAVIRNIGNTERYCRYLLGDAETGTPPDHRLFGPTRYRTCAGCGIRNPARPACPVCGSTARTLHKLGPCRLVRFLLWLIAWYPPEGGEKPDQNRHVRSKAERIIQRVLMLLLLGTFLVVVTINRKSLMDAFFH